LIDIFGNEVILLHVLPGNLKKSSFQQVVERSVRGELKKLKKDLSGACGHKVSAKFVYGNIVDCVLDEAEKEDVNLILVNTGTSDPETPQGLGLNAQKIIRTARKPVGVITEDAPVATNKLVCPVDNSEASGIALRSAILTAKKLDLKLSVLSVYEPIIIASPRMLYMGSTGKSGLRRAWIGSVTEKVTQEVPCSMIVSKYEEVYKLRISTEVEDIEQHFKRGNELAGLGYFTEALEQYKMCLQINDIHLPSIRALSDLYAKMGNESQHTYYQNLGKTLLTKLVNR
jgi:nucleotide-binding universal stress UspA family protein